MRVSKLFTRTTKQAPSDETSKNAQLLIRAGFVEKDMAGVYSYLPLGLRVLNNIAQIVREEMDAIGGQEILMPTLQVKERYEATNRWSDEAVDVWFKTKLHNGSELGLGFTHEENLVPIMKNYVNSYRDLPLTIYQIQTKFRNELRSKSGLMRGREFLMKDMYSFAATDEQDQKMYEDIKQAYIKVYQRLGIGEETFVTFASGGVFSKYSHEFQTISLAGEDTIYLDRDKQIAVNKEVLRDDILAELGLKRDTLEEVKAIEVGNIFHLATKYSEPFDLSISDQTGAKTPVLMGCYGLGVSRLIGAIAEHYSDDKGLVWPAAVAPYQVYLVRLSTESEVIQAADTLYKQLTTNGVSVLYDDREDARAGEMFADADLIGCPVRLTVSPKTLKEQSVELKYRKETEFRLIPIKSVGKTLTDSK